MLLKMHIKYPENGTLSSKVRQGDREGRMATDQQARLAVELGYYAQHKAEWLAHKTGSYVVIKDSKVLGFFANFETAYRAGAEMYGMNTDFLVKQILEHEPAYFVF